MARNKIGLVSLTCAFLLMTALTFCFHPVLRATPERRGALWVGTSDGIARFALQDYSLELKVGDLGEIRSIALDDWNARVWVYGNGTLRAFGFGGERLLSVPVESQERKRRHGHDGPKDDDNERCSLIVDPADGGAWVAGGASLYRFSIQGDPEVRRDFHWPIRGLAMDSVYSRLWVATEKTLTAHDRSGNEVASIDPGRRAGIQEIALDPSTGDLWVASGQFLGRIDSSGDILFWRFSEGFSRMAHDGQGGLWAARDNTLWRLDACGKVLFKVRPFGKWWGGDIVDFALDQKDSSLCVINRKSAARVSPDGELLGSANLSQAVHDRLFAAALYRDVRPPTLRITSPSEGSFIPSATPEIELTFSDAESGVDTNSLEVRLDDAAVDVACTFTKETGSCTPVTGISDGPHVLTASIRDLEANSFKTPPVAFTVDTTPPRIAISSPEDRFITSQGEITVRGATSEKAQVIMSGTGILSDDSGAFSASLTLIEGDNAIEISATDRAGNTTTVTVRGTRDSLVPAIPVTSLIRVGAPEGGQVTVSGAPESVEAGVRVTVTNLVTGDTKWVTAAGDGSFTVIIGATFGESLSITVTDPAGNSSNPATVSVSNPLPPAAEVIPEGSFGAAYRDLVPQDATIEEYAAHRFSLVTGLVLGIGGEPVAGVTAGVHGHPEYGTVATDASGHFSIPVEGGGTLTIAFQKSGLITSHRQVDVPWNGYATVEPIQMIAEDSAATVVTFDGNASTLTTHRSTGVADDSGERSCTLVFSGDNRAYSLDARGNVTGELTTITTRATEFKTPESMPAKLPPNSGYTYCSELKVDGVERVRFEKPVIMWVDNFLGFPVGQAVPVGTYDRDKGAWVPADNGRVVKLLDRDGNGTVDALDATGDGQPDDLNGNGLHEDEVAGLDDAARYAPDATFWRVSVMHFTPWDCNWPYGPPADAIPPNPEGLPDADQQLPEVKSCPLPINSFVEERSRIFHDDIPIAGTDMTLHYASSRAQGYKHVITIPASGPSVPSSLRRITVHIQVAGRTLGKELPPMPNQSAEFHWDGLDLLRRKVTGTVNVRVSIGFAYPAAYLTPGNFSRAFAQFGGNITGNRSRQEVTTWKRYDMTIDANRGSGSIAEGWTLSAHHMLDPRDPSTMHRGDGGKVTSSAQILTTLAGTGATGFSGDGGPATQAQLNWPFRVTVHPSGDVYLADVRNNRIRKIDVEGVITTIAGGGSPCAGDGSPAVNACLSNPQKLAFDSSGNMYIAETSAGRVRKVDTNNMITTVASGLSHPDSVAVDLSGNIYIAEQYANRVRKLDTNGALTTLVSGGFKDITDLALDGSGNLYIADRYGCRVARLDTSGKMTTVAGTGSCGYGGDGGPATSARLGYLYGIAIDAGGNLLIADSSNARVRRVDNRGTIATIAGNGTWAVGTEGEPATRTSLYGPFGVAAGPDGSIYVTEPDAPRVRKISSEGRFSALLQHGSIPFAEAGGLGHVFSATGEHLKTLDVDSGTTLQTLEYDDRERLAAITDRFGNVATIERDQQGLVTGILSPDGLRTGLTIDSEGRLTRITHPDRAHTDFEYSPDGLLTAKIEPNGNRYTHTFDSNGRLTDASDQEGGSWHYSRSRRQNGETLIERTTAEGNRTSYLDRTDSTGAYTSRITDPTGGETIFNSSADELTARKSLSCGMVLDFQYGLDPHYRFKVAKQTVETTPSNLKRSTVFDKSYEDTDGNKVPDRITEKATVNGKTTTFLHDILRARHISTTPEGRMATLAYDPATLLASSVSIPGLYDTFFSYDERGRLTGVTTNSRETHFAYDESGNLSSVTDPEERTTTYTHDGVGRVTGVQRPDETTLGFTYDENGNMTVLTSPSAIRHDFGTNRVNLTDSYDTPFSGSYRYTYDRDRRLRAIRFPSGKSIENLYDRTNLDRVLTPEGEIDFSYLCASKVGSITMGAEQVSYGYDGSLVTSETLSGTLGATVGFTYNADFRVSRMTYAGGAFDFGYDKDGLLTRSGAFTISRNPQNGLPETVSGGPLSLSRTFNGYGEMDGEISRVNGSDLHSWNVTRTDSGRIRSRTEAIQGVSTELTYDYDALGRLVSVTKDGTLVEEYRYGPNGNRTFERNLLRGISGRSFTYSDEDHLLASGDTTYEYDADGFLTSKTRGSQVTEYRYSSRGELLSATLPSGTVIEYLHDPLGRRIGKKVNGAITEKYLWQGMTRLLAVYDGSDNLLMRFQYADSRMPVSMTLGAATYYLTYDQVGSLRTVTDATGNIVKRIDYDSFGNILSDSNPTFAMPLGFAGGLFDPHTTLVRFGFRDYDPDTGRWTAKDPILFGGGDTNLYGYVQNDPITRIDPWGEQDISVETDPMTGLPYLKRTLENGKHYPHLGGGGGGATAASRTKWGPEHGSGNKKHNNAIEDRLDWAACQGAMSLRKNKLQVDVNENAVSRKRPDASYVLEGTRYNDNFVSNYALDSVTELNRELQNFKEMMKSDPEALNSLQIKY